MKNLTICILFFICILILGCSRQASVTENNIPSFKLLSQQEQYTAGDQIVIEFDNDITLNTYLVINNSLGTSAIKPIENKKKLSFEIPENYAQKSGVCNWSLVHNSQIHQTGVLNLVPNSSKENRLESYLGPRSLTAGNGDYSMFVIIPMDIFGNPLPDNTSIISKVQFENEIKETTLLTKDLISWTTIYSPKKSGRMLVSATSNSTDSKEFTTIVYPANATNFEISYTRNHKYADGNQVITFKTTQLKDEFGNSISDGTLVTFIVTNSKGAKLKAQGTTINGIAEARLLHPVQKEIWEVKAFVLGAAESQKITLNFEASIIDFEINISKNGRTITIGPLKGFMNQLVPDGIPIDLKIFDTNDKEINSFITSSIKGEATFLLSQDFFPNGNYKIVLETAGIIKSRTVLLK